MVTNLKNNNFNEKLEHSRGSERLIEQILIDHGWLVIPLYDYTGKIEHAPVLKSKGKNVIVPDLDVSKNGLRRWIEVKSLYTASYTRLTKRLEHGIDTSKWNNYLKVQEVTGCEVWLFIHEYATGNLLGRSLDALKSKIRYSHMPVSNNYEKGMVYFPRGEFMLLGKWESDLFKSEMHKFEVLPNLVEIGQLKFDFT